MSRLIIGICSILALALANSVSRVARQAQTDIIGGPNCECVPFHQCDLRGLDPGNPSIRVINDIINIR